MYIGAVLGNDTIRQQPQVGMPPLKPAQLAEQGSGQVGPNGSFGATQAAMASQFNQVAAPTANAQAENARSNGDRQEAPGNGQTGPKNLTFDRRGRLENGVQPGSRVSIRT